MGIMLSLVVQKTDAGETPVSHNGYYVVHSDDVTGLGKHSGSAFTKFGHNK